MGSTYSIKWRESSPKQPGFRIYEDAMDSFVGEPSGIGQPVYLQVDGVPVELQTRPEGGASVTMTLPRELALELGLVTFGSGIETPVEGGNNWDIRAQGRAWRGDEASERHERLPEGVRIEMIHGRLFWQQEDRLTLLALLLENVGAEHAVRLGDPEVWRAAVGALKT